MDGLRDHLERFRDTFLSSDHSHVLVNDMWVSFKSEVIVAIERFIPTKMTKTKYSLSWIDSSIRRLIRKREKLYFHARKSSSPDVKNHYSPFTGSGSLLLLRGFQSFAKSTWYFCFTIIKHYHSAK